MLRMKMKQEILVAGRDHQDILQIRKNGTCATNGPLVKIKVVEGHNVAQIDIPISEFLALVKDSFEED